MVKNENISKKILDASWYELIRQLECKRCTNINERDINASINIMFEGLKMYMEMITKRVS